MQASVTFEPSQGQLAMVIYEWNDVKYLGKITSTTDDTLPVSEHSRNANRTSACPSFLKQYIAENVCMYHKRRTRRFLFSD